jgi:hypothetical protein
MKVFFLGGYPVVQSLWDALVNITLPGIYDTANGINAPLGNWEFTIYIGLLGALFLIFFGIYRTLRGWPIVQGLRQTDDGVEQGSPYRVLLLPCLVFTLFSFTAVFEELRVLISIPPLSGERVASRLFIFTILFLMLLAVYELQKWWDTIHLNSFIALCSLFLFGYELNDLWQNFRFWAVAHAATTFPNPSTFEQGNWFVANHPDVHYFTLLIIGLIITCISLAALAFLVRQEKRRMRAASQS